ncbi:MAG: hypothetical protein RMJ67_06075 [Elusimicrobiota bacterium]|nr:hypothetical protein [Endomicrobiia bacterium]MDW8166060.1 hypothetical protein [Elusimicrobiota bacterium]
MKLITFRFSNVNNYERIVKTQKIDENYILTGISVNRLAVISLFDRAYFNVIYNKNKIFDEDINIAFLIDIYSQSFKFYPIHLNSGDEIGISFIHYLDNIYDSEIQFILQLM